MILEFEYLKKKYLKIKFKKNLRIKFYYKSSYYKRISYYLGNIFS